MNPSKNFFAIFSSPKSPQIFSRESEMLSPKCSEFYHQFNSPVVPNFVYTSLVSKFVHFINNKKDFQNQGRLELAPDLPFQYNYTQRDITSILQIMFNKDDSDLTILFLTGSGTPKGELVLWCTEGEVPLAYETVFQCWANRTSKNRNRELLIICDFCFSGSWVNANQAPDIYIQAACSEKEKCKDIRMADNIVGSAFLHNLLMVNNGADCFLDGVQQTPKCSFLKPDQVDRVRNNFGMNVMFRNWDDMKALFRDQKFKLFNKDEILYDGNEPTTRKEVTKKSGKKYSANVEQRLEVARRLFRMFDRDGSGFLDDAEIPKLIAETYKSMGMTNYTPSKDDVSSWLDMGDTNKDGKVSLEECEEVVISSLRKAGIKLD